MTEFSEGQVKEAFQKVKRDIEFLTSNLFSLKEELSKTQQEMLSICEILKDISIEIKEISKNSQKKQISETTLIPTDRQINQTAPTHNPTDNMPLKPLKDLNKVLSTGNEGVPTDKQTDKQTDNKSQKNPIEDAAKILDSLDSIKKEIRLKFKSLTDQEVLIFSTLYQVEEELGPVDYRTIAQKIGLTESSIRDYVGRLLKKGIPIEKKKVNNKQIKLSISPNLKKIASLSTILQLRDL